MCCHPELTKDSVGLLDQAKYYGRLGDIESALNREKQFKGIARAKKIAIIETENKEWQDLRETWS